MFRNSQNQNEFYDIKLPGEQKKHVFSELASKAKNYPPQPRKHRESAVSSALKNLTTRIVYSAVIFIALFLILNWQSYGQIFKAKVDEWRGEAKTSVLQELIDREFETQEKITVKEKPEVQPEPKSEPEKRSLFIKKKSSKKFDLNKLEPQQKPAKLGKKQSKLLKISKNPEVEKQNIPPLSMEIRPPDTRLIIPRINRNVPIVQVRAENLLKRDWDSLEDDIMEALRFGIVHFPGTAMPGEHGNIALTGHSSYFPWDPGRFKDVFALLHEVKIGDQILLYHKQKKYIYEASDIKITKPDDISVLEPTDDDRLTLITCTPIGTDLRRLVVTAKLIKIS